MSARISVLQIQTLRFSFLSDLSKSVNCVIITIVIIIIITSIIAVVMLIVVATVIVVVIIIFGIIAIAIVLLVVVVIVIVSTRHPAPFAHQRPSSFIVRSFTSATRRPSSYIITSTYLASRRATIPTQTGGRPSHAGAQQCDVQLGGRVGDQPKNWRAGIPKTAGDQP